MKPLPLPQEEARGGRGRGQHELSTYRSAGVQHSQETRGTHKTDTKQEGRGKEKQREEEVQLTTQRTLHKKERQSTHRHHMVRNER